MIATCKNCGTMFETTTEDAYHPDGTECPECYHAERARVADPKYIPTVDEAMRHPDAFVESMTEMHRYRVHLRSVPSPAWTFYEGYVDVWADDSEDAVERALNELRRTSFRDRPRDGWRVARVERLG
jgi:hypothetical protein